MIAVFKNAACFIRPIYSIRVVFIALAMSSTACSTPYPADEEEWAAHGFLSPAPTGESELIGVYGAHADCKAAAEEWMSRQVAGVRIFADCFPVDRN